MQFVTVTDKVKSVVYTKDETFFKGEGKTTTPFDDLVNAMLETDWIFYGPITYNTDEWGDVFGCVAMVKVPKTSNEVYNG